jgi:hypothetical protein
MQARKVLYFNSAQATSKTLASGIARFQYSQPIEPFLPSCKVALTQFNYTNFFINISAPNNVINYSDNAVLPQKYTITIPNGSWGLSDLNDYCASQQMSQVGVLVFALEANYSVGKVAITFQNVTGWFVNLVATSPSILGFTLPQHVPVTDNNAAYYSQLGNNAASFNTITQVKVLSNLVQDGIDNSALSSNVLHISTPTVGIGSVQADQPTNLLTLESTILGTGKVSEINFQIVDQNNSPINLSEDFGITLIVV